MSLRNISKFNINVSARAGNFDGFNVRSLDALRNLDIPNLRGVELDSLRTINFGEFNFRSIDALDGLNASQLRALDALSSINIRSLDLGRIEAPKINAPKTELEPGRIDAPKTELDPGRIDAPSGDVPKTSWGTRISNILTYGIGIFGVATIADAWLFGGGLFSNKMLGKSNEANKGENGNGNSNSNENGKRTSETEQNSYGNYVEDTGIKLIDNMVYLLSELGIKDKKTRQYIVYGVIIVLSILIFIMIYKMLFGNKKKVK